MSQPFMSVPGMIYIVKDAAIHVYIYADAMGGSPSGCDGQGSIPRGAGR